MTVDNEALAQRSKVLGALMRDFRQASGKGVDACAQVMGVSEERFEAYELGEASPSLPELECFAYYLEIPLENFVEGQSIGAVDDLKELPHIMTLVAVRQRMVGAKLRQARIEVDVPLDQLAEQMQMDVADLEAYEFSITLNSTT